MIGMVTPSAFAVQTIQGEDIPYDVPYGCTSQDVMSSNKHSLMNISLRAYTPNPDVNVIIQVDGKIIKNQSIPIKIWTSVSAIFELANYSPGPGAKAMKLHEIKICLLNTSTDDGEKLLRLDSVRTSLSSEKIPTNEATIAHSKSDHIFKVSFNKSTYYTGDKVKIILKYPEYNQMHKFDIFGEHSNEVVNIQTKTGSLNGLTLTETGINTGIFTRDILLSGPNGHISHSIDGTSITNANYDYVIVTIEDEFSNKITSASASISSSVSKTSESKSLPIIPSNLVVDCSPKMVNFNVKASEELFIDVGNPDADNCQYNVILHDANRSKIKTLGTVFFTETMVIDDNISDGNYWIMIKSFDGSYSNFFSLSIEHTKTYCFSNSPGGSNCPVTKSDSVLDLFPNNLVLIIIPIIVIVTIVIVFVTKKKSKTVNPKNTGENNSEDTSLPPVDPKYRKESPRTPINSEPKKEPKKSSSTRQKTPTKTATSASSSTLDPEYNAPKTPSEALDELARKINPDYKTKSTSPPPVDPKYATESTKGPIQSEPKKSQKKASQTMPKQPKRTVDSTIDSELDRILNATNPLEVLGLPTGTSFSVIRATYRELTIKYDPSKGIVNKSDIEKQRDQKVSTNLNRAYGQLKRQNRG